MTEKLAIRNKERDQRYELNSPRLADSYKCIIPSTRASSADMSSRLVGIKGKPWNDGSTSKSILEGMSFEFLHPAVVTLESL